MNRQDKTNGIELFAPYSQRIIVSGRTATRESRPSKNFESIDSKISHCSIDPSPARAAFNVEGELSTQKEVLRLEGPR